MAGKSTDIQLTNTLGLRSFDEIMNASAKDLREQGATNFKDKEFHAAFAARNRGYIDQSEDLSSQIAKQTKGIDPREQRAKQTALAQALEAQAAGQGPSLAESQLRSATDRSLAQQLALAAMSRGNTAATARNLLRNQAAVNQDVSRQAAELRMQEQMQARQQLSDLLTQARQQDIAQQTTTNQFQMGLIDQQAGLSEADRQALIAKEAQRRGLQHANIAASAQRDAGMTQAIGGAIGAVGSALLSDERLKEDKKDGSHEVKEFLDAIAAKTYKYKEPEKHGKGKHLGIMAQDLEKSEIGKSMVINSPEGKLVDFGKGFGAILAAQAELNKRLEELEQLSKKKRG